MLVVVIYTNIPIRLYYCSHHTHTCVCYICSHHPVGHSLYWGIGISIASKIAGEERKIMGKKKGIHQFVPIDFITTNLFLRVRFPSFIYSVLIESTALSS